MAEKVRHVDAVLDSVAQMLEDTGKTNTLSTVSDMTEMAFGNPSYMMGGRGGPLGGPLGGEPEFPYPFRGLQPGFMRGPMPTGMPGFFEDPMSFPTRMQVKEASAAALAPVPKSESPADTSAGTSLEALEATETQQPQLSQLSQQSQEPRLIIHESPTVKVTKVEGSDKAAETRSDADNSTNLKSLFLGFPTYSPFLPEREGSMEEGSMEGVDHESLHSDDVGINYGDDEDDGVDEGDDDDYDKLPVVLNGKNYFRSMNSQRVFEAKDDGTPGECVGVWLHDSFVPLVVG
jgi:hypothetical protein